MKPQKLNRIHFEETPGAIKNMLKTPYTSKGSPMNKLPFLNKKPDIKSKRFLSNANQRNMYKTQPSTNLRANSTIKGKTENERIQLELQGRQTS